MGGKEKNFPIKKNIRENELRLSQWEKNKKKVQEYNNALKIREKRNLPENKEIEEKNKNFYPTQPLKLHTGQKLQFP